MKAMLYSLSFAFLLSISPSHVFAQSLCGTISGSELLGSPSIEIEDCNDPFGVTTDPVNPYTLTVNGNAVFPGATIELLETDASVVSYTGTPGLSTVATELFRHESGGYELFRLESEEPTEADYRATAETFFASAEERAFYLEIIVYNFEHTNLDHYFFDPTTGEDLIDAVTGETIQERYYAFIDATYESFDGTVRLESGTYTMLFYEQHLEQTTNTLWDSIRDFILPTAYAQCVQCIPNRIYTITFTIERVSEPQGASSVLFLPGIMGSRLYEESDACSSGEVVEQERWFSTTDCDQLRFLTDFMGSSLNDIYTKPSQTAVIDETFGFNLYKTFLNNLAIWQSEGTIAAYKAVPYDWRLSLDDILKLKIDPHTNRVVYSPSTPLTESYLYNTLEELAEASPSKTVTIVAHSNGGLVAKALLERLEQANDPLAKRVNNLILVAVPQVGTPESLVGMLHGTALGPAGTVVSQSTARQILNTAPFAHHLLPNQSYFQSDGVTVDTPVLSFEEGVLTTPWRTQFGATVSNVDSLHAFLNKSSGRTTPAQNDLLTPATVDGFLLNYAQTIDQQLQNWTPSASTTVYQIAGTGLTTPTGITYFTKQECIERNPLRLFACTQHRDALDYRVNVAVDGDETVVAPSALVMSDASQNIKRRWVDLKKFNRDVVVNRRHKDIFEVEDVSSFIKNTIQGNIDFTYEYLSSTPPSLSSEDRLVFSLHSPLDLSLVSASGGEVSSSTETIPGAVYKRYGELQYISVPDTTEAKTLVLAGEATGSFTLDIEEYEERYIKNRHTYSGIPSSTSTKVTMNLGDADSIEEAVLVVDYDGNGTADIAYDTVGEVPTEVTYEMLLTYIESLQIIAKYKKQLTKKATAGQRFNKRFLVKYRERFKIKEQNALVVLKQQITVYEGLHIISEEESDNLLEIVDGLVIK
jgi:pimeloyl-ACP methyl ester carboxylesterase